MKKVFIHSLGCAKNLVDSEYWAHNFHLNGYGLTSVFEQADVYFINTCGFIASAKEESIDVILEALEWKEEKAGRKVIVAGCLTERYRQDILEEFPEIDYVGGVRDALNAPLFSHHEAQRYPLLPHYTSYLRISDGCDNGCFYCAIPLIRGPLQSRSESELLKEAEQLAERGVKELIVIAQDTANYGRDQGAYALPQLLKKLAQLPFTWIRVMYLHPGHVRDELIDVMAHENQIVPYIEMPIQHAHPRILKAMNRFYTPEAIIELMQKFRNQIPDCFLRTTVMVGYPGETQKEFEFLLDFIQKNPFERLGVFTFSAEDGTQAFDFPNPVPEELAQDRFDEVMSVQQTISERLLSKRLGETVPVLVERLENDCAVGRSIYDAPEIDGIVFLDQAAPIGEIVEAVLEENNEYDYFASIADGKLLRFPEK